MTKSYNYDILISTNEREVLEMKWLEYVMARYGVDSQEAFDVACLVAEGFNGEIIDDFILSLEQE